MHTAFLEKAIAWAVSLLHYASAQCELTFIKEFLESYFDQYEAGPVQSELCSCIHICILTDQSEQLHNDQSEGQFRTIRTVLFGPNELQLWIPHLQKKKVQSRIRVGAFFIQASLPFLSGEHNFGFPQRLSFPGLQTVLLEWSCSFCHLPDWGLLVALDG